MVITVPDHHAAWKAEGDTISVFTGFNKETVFATPGYAEEKLANALIDLGIATLSGFFLLLIFKS